jgi:peptidoglycan/LPS O-acetylase OafA/YrhL
MSRNYASLSKPDGGHEGLKVLNGIRVIAIGLVVLGHTYAFLRVDNQPYASNIVETRFMTYWIIGVHTDSSGGAFLSVDSFFFLSGFLAMLSQLEKYSLGDGKRLSPCKYWGQAMMYRFLRLTPMYLFTLMIYIYVYPQFGNGPNWMTGDLRQTKPDGTVQDFCREAWWTNVSQSCYASILRYP